jgi:hypothetical protein
VDMRSAMTLTLLAVTLQIPSFAQQNVPVKVTITSPTPVAKSGAPIRIDVSVLNLSDHVIKILKPLGFDGQAEFVNHVQVYDAQGKPLVWIAGRHSAVSRKTISVEPGKSESDFMILSNLYDMTKPGRYKVAIRHELIQFGTPRIEDMRSFVPSNTLDITVTD